MNSLVQHLLLPSDGAPMPASPLSLSRYLTRLADEIGADHYLLADVVPDGGGVSILACNWVYDAVRSAGPDLLHRIVQSPRTTAFATPARIWTPADAATGAEPFMSTVEAEMLDGEGHAEFAAGRIRAGGRCHCVIFSSSHAGGIVHSLLGAAYVSLSYALGGLAGSSDASPLSGRERECLFWVSEGKTTEEAASILGVSSNTVNGYLASAIQKLSARNRAMAIATAIRGGLI